MSDTESDLANRYAQYVAPTFVTLTRRAVDLAEIESGNSILDLATGTGNAALLAAGAGAVVTGLDAAARLIDVARARAAAEGVGLIFAGDARRGFDEMMRVLRPSGRALFRCGLRPGRTEAEPRSPRRADPPEFPSSQD